MRYKNIIRAIVKADSKKNLLELKENGVFKIEVKERARSGAANGRARALLASHFKIPEKAVILISGATRANKHFAIIKEIK